MAKDMSGKVALVTGGSSGIGTATALAFANSGAYVAITSRSQDAGQAIVERIRKMDGEAIWIQTDVTQAKEVEAMIRQVIDKYGRLDYAFNNAGSVGAGGLMADITETAWDHEMDTFLKSVWLCMKYEIPAMLKTGGGAIVNNSSGSGKRGFRWNPAYSAAKHGVIGLTKSAALQYASQGIRINAVCPGWIRTPPIESWFERDPNAEKSLVDHHPIGRLGEPEEIAQAVMWLCSNSASFIVGATLDLDGGYLSDMPLPT